MTTRTLTQSAAAPQSAAIAYWLELIQAEYREMPCLSLTKPQMRRLWGLDTHVCDALIEALIQARVLRRRLDGAYISMASGR